MRELVLDWRGVPDLSKPAECYSIAATNETRPILGNPSGKVFVGISSTILFGPNGQPADRPYNKALYEVASKIGAMTGYEVWRGSNGYSTRLFDITKRVMPREWMKLLEVHFPWADGFHIDYFTAMSWAFPALAPFDEMWDSALGNIANNLRAKGKLVLGQQFHLTNPLMAVNGAFVEQSPFAWGYTLSLHAKELLQWREMVRRVDPRPEMWVFEVRDYLTWPPSTLQMVKTWAEQQDVLLCLGRK